MFFFSCPTLPTPAESLLFARTITAGAYDGIHVKSIQGTKCRSCVYECMINRTKYDTRCSKLRYGSCKHTPQERLRDARDATERPKGPGLSTNSAPTSSTTIPPCCVLLGCSLLPSASLLQAERRHNQLRKLAAFHVTSARESNLTTQADSRNITPMSYLLRIASATAIVEGLIVQHQGKRKRRIPSRVTNKGGGSAASAQENIQGFPSFSRICFTTGTSGVPRGRLLIDTVRLVSGSTLTWH